MFLVEKLKIKLSFLRDGKNNFFKTKKPDFHSAFVVAGAVRLWRIEPTAFGL